MSKIWEGPEIKIGLDVASYDFNFTVSVACVDANPPDQSCVRNLMGCKSAATFGVKLKRISLFDLSGKFFYFTDRNWYIWLLILQEKNIAVVLKMNRHVDSKYFFPTAKPHYSWWTSKIWRSCYEYLFTKSNNILAKNIKFCNSGKSPEEKDMRSHLQKCATLQNNKNWIIIS